MRYWHPMTQEVVQQVKNYVPDEIILLPLYPQFSTTTTGSSFSQWDNCMKNEGLKIPTRKICCYSMQENYVNAHAEQISQALKITDILPRILFSAHGLPEKIIKKGDPYQWQVEQNVAAIVQKLSIPDLDYSVCYQSRVGPLKWIGPSTEEELKKAGEQKKSVMVVPIAFVSEHSETLVELDIEYKHLAQEAGVPEYIRVPALATHSLFIEGLSRLCVDAGHDKPIACHTGGRICPKEFSQCPAQGVR
jgi:ferrochelatase